MQTLSIRPMARRNYLIFSLVGALLLLISVLLQLFSIGLPAYVLMVVGLIGCVFGVAKRLEPEFSFTLTPQGFIWHLRQDNIQVSWDNFVQINALSVDKGQGKTDLHYLGLKLWDITPVVQSIAPRAAKSLFHEYRSLLHVALAEAEYRSDVTHHFQEDEEVWRDSSGVKHTGLIGMFAARLQQIKRYLGADLYIPVTSLDRSPDDFIQLFKHYKQEYKSEH